MFIQRDSDHDAWLKATAGAPYANATLLAEFVERPVEAVDLPAAQRELSAPGDNGNGNQG